MINFLMINFLLLPMGRRHQLGRLSPALLLLAGVLVAPQQPLQAGGMASSERPLVAQASPGAVAVQLDMIMRRLQVRLLMQQGKFAEAIPLQQQDLAWTEKTYGSNHPSTATSLNNLAEL
jgi:hypothetical protein